jgi:hypothetical protein
MKRTQILGGFFAAVAALFTSAHAQSQSTLPPVWPGYPGSILVAPQQANLLAPALYRTEDDWDHLENPVGVVQICERDLQLLRKKGIVRRPQPVAAASFQNHQARLVGGKLRVDARVVGANVNADYDQLVTLSTGAVQVHETDDDDISKTVLRNVSPACRRTIAHHLNLQRWVFVAAKAIQAYDYDAVFERVASGAASANCSIFCWGKAKAEITGRITDKNRSVAEKTFVTIALVPAEVEDRQFISLADLQGISPALKTRRLARVARSAKASMPDGNGPGWNMSYARATVMRSATPNPRLFQRRLVALGSRPDRLARAELH